MNRTVPTPACSAQSYSENPLPLCLSGDCNSPSIPHGNSRLDDYSDDVEIVRSREDPFNSRFANALRTKHPHWKDALAVEKSGVFPNAPQLRPDILIRAPNSQPVVIETEYEPAPGVEADARACLGLVPASSSDPIEQSIAVRVPNPLIQTQASLPARIATADFGYCVISGDPSSPVRWPLGGWLTGGIDDIVRCIEHAMVSQRLIDESISILERGVRVATGAVADAKLLGCGGIERHLGQVLNQQSGEQTTRMAMTMIANALTFHASITSPHAIPSVSQIQTRHPDSLQAALLDTWKETLAEVNYWPILKVASDLLAPIRVPTANRILDPLARAADQLSEMGVNTRHDLSGRMFQSLITDRKFLATFYTLPTSATLLAELATRRLDTDWGDLPGYKQLSIADLSCGTGTLLSAAYHAVLTRYRHAGGDDSEIHRHMIEHSIIGTDIMPAATHLCTSQLSSVHPTVVFDNTRVYTMPYGIDRDGEHGRGVTIGSLDLTAKAQTWSLFATGQKQASGKRGDLDTQDIEVPHESVDLVIMNPPFTRPTNHESSTVPVPSFAGFRTTHDEQRAMSDRLAEIRGSLASPVGHGNAGLASSFIDLAHAKVRPGGTMAMVLPMTAIQGASWQPARQLLAERYKDVAVVSIASAGNLDRAFSADTGMAETLVLGTKRRDAVQDPEAALFVNLHRRPASLLEAAEIAKLVSRVPDQSRTGRVQAGDQLLGSYIRAPLSEGGCAALRESVLAEIMISLHHGNLVLPRHGDRHAIPVARLKELGGRGLLDRDIGSRKDTQAPYRGPFKIVPIQGVPSYPVLWGHAADRERHLVVEPDAAGEVLPDCAERAAERWKTATRLHFNRDFRLNSQSLAACLTDERVLGGRAWPNFKPKESAWEQTLALWANSTLGLMSFWWAGSRQQQGRVRLTISALPELLVLDPRTIADDKLGRASEIFESLRGRPLLPANEAYRDQVRVELDHALLGGVLKLPGDALEALDTVRRQWCSEPSVHGGKRTAPSDRGEG